MTLRLWTSRRPLIIVRSGGNSYEALSSVFSIFHKIE